jgi:hypothetical protein
LLTVECVDVRGGLEVAWFNVTRPNHAADGEHVQHRPELFPSCVLFPHAVKGRHEHAHDVLHDACDLHPKDAAEVFVNLSRALALTTAGKQLSDLRLLHAAEDELIIPAATARAGLAMDVSADCPDFSLLLHHGVPPRQVDFTWASSCERTRLLKIPKR